MLNYTDDFRSSIKASARSVNARLTFTANEEVYTITENEIVEINYLSSIKKEIGDVVLKALDAKLRDAEATRLLKEGAVIKLSYICGGGECEVDLFYIDSIASKDNVITIHAYDMLTWISNKGNCTMPIGRDMYLSDYIVNAMKSLGVKAVLNNNITNQKLSVAWPKSSKLLDTLRELAVASNSIIKFGETSMHGAYLPFKLPKTLNDAIVGAEVSKLEFTDPLETVDSWIDIEMKNEGSNKYNDVRVPLYSPYLSTDKKIGTIKALIPQNVSHYCPGTAELDNTFIPSVIKVDKRIEIDDISITSKGVSIYFNNSLPIATEITVELYGSSIENTSILSADTSNTNNIKVINNMYIQSATVYDTDIYKCSDIEFNYFGNPLIEVGDTVHIDGKDVLVLEHSLKYDGGLRGTVKGVIKCS